MFEPKPAQGFNPAAPAADRMTKVLPTDLRQQQFTVAFRGYDRVEVAAFLAEVAEDYEHALREVDRLQQDVRRMEVLLEEYREHERHLRNALLAAQKLSDGIKETAEQESRRILNEAEGKSELLVSQAQTRLEGIRREIEELRFRRRDVEVSLESAISGLKRSLDLIREQERRDDPRGDRGLADPAAAEGGPSR
jgi:cell division initiation protein